MTTPLNQQTTFGTNPAGQIVSITNTVTQTSTFAYELGDLVSVQTPLGHREERFVDTAGRVASARHGPGL